MERIQVLLCRVSDPDLTDRHNKRPPVSSSWIYITKNLKKKVHCITSQTFYDFIPLRTTYRKLKSDNPALYHCSKSGFPSLYQFSKSDYPNVQSFLPIIEKAPQTIQTTRARLTDPVPWQPGKQARLPRIRACQQKKIICILISSFHSKFQRRLLRNPSCRGDKSLEKLMLK